MGKWEIFELGGRTVIPKMSIRKGGQIGLNSAAVKKFELEKYKYVVLKINEDEQKVGLQFTSDEKEKGAKIFKIVQGGISLPAKSFIEYYHLEKIKERRMHCDWIKSEAMVVAKYSK